MKKSSSPISDRSGLDGFTLIELLVVISIIAVLMGIAFPIYQSVTTKAKMSREIQAGRNLITAFIAAASDRDGVFPGGYDRTVTEVPLANGTSLSGVPAQRYPFRLAPYLSYQLNGTVLVNDNVSQISSTDNYMISCYPALAINYLFVGGDISATGVNSYPNECITRMANASSSPLVFASAAGDSSPNKIRGYCILTPPQTNGSMWSTSPWKTTSSASDYGNVDPRFNKKAVCVFLDGSTKLLGIEDLRDMRYWSKNAAEQNNPNYVIPRASTGGRL